MILISEFSVSLSVLCQNIKLFPCYRKDFYMQRDARLPNIYIVFISQTAHPYSPFLILHLRLQNYRKYLLILFLPLTPVSRNNFYTPKWPNPTHYLPLWELQFRAVHHLPDCSSCFCRIQLKFQLLLPVLLFQAVFWALLAEENVQTSKSHLQQCWHLLIHGDASLTDRLAPGWKSWENR